MSEWIKFCNMSCKYAESVGSERDGAGCRIWIAIYCEKKKKTVFKNSLCREKELRSGTS